MSGRTKIESSLEETVEQAADAISSALDFLRRESDAIGLRDVSELIGQARTKAGERGAGSG